ncbi:hypothetical protein BDV95DRAFT_632762 [Massariosphaeria phaeospora]|uniref:Methyltransferase-domain-containing protein n=1 Tax=Massariosphaeria phaeospora TaxID=100035 RepID=A0A7C8M0Y7_9PLEO|nr:hypothetical protein BDV95DRAFT_632762 [Massariosphaeria phaeospora]
MSLTDRCLAPTSSLPPVRSLRTAAECPPSHPKAAAALVDSGYASEDEDEDSRSAIDEGNSAIRADDGLERDFAVRWLTALISRAEEIEFSSEDLRERIVDDAALNWGASNILSGAICACPARFGLEQLARKPSPIVVGLGAGTGLVSLVLTLVLAGLLPHLSVVEPRVIATDYQTAVLDNLRVNISTNVLAQPGTVLQTALLDCRCCILARARDMATAGRMLALDGTFFLQATARKVGKFEGIADTVEAAFAGDACPQRDGHVLAIVEKEWLERRQGIGRGDESGYNVHNCLGLTDQLR